MLTKYVKEAEVQRIKEKNKLESVLIPMFRSIYECLNIAGENETLNKPDSLDSLSWLLKLAADEKSK